MSRGPAVVAVAIAGALAACDAAAPRLVIEGGPIVVLREDEVAVLRLRGAAGPLTATAEVDGVFATLAIDAVPGDPRLRVRPRCDVIGPGDPDALVRVVVTDGAGAAATLMVQIGDEPGAPCAPALEAALGACAGATAAVDELTVTPADDRLCLRVVSRDPGRERLWVRSSTDAPTTLVAPTAVPFADDAAAPVAFELALGDSTDLRGRFRLPYQLWRRAPGAAPPDAAGALTLVVGPPGTAIEVTSAPATIAEMNAGTLALRVWHRDDAAPTAATCARVRWTPAAGALARDLPFARLLDGFGTGAVELGSAGGASPWLCAHELRLRVSPAIDARAVEPVTVEAGPCDCATATPTGATVARVLAIAVDSVAEHLACTTPTTTGLARAGCADLDGDGTPEIVMATDDGACAFRGADRRLAPVPFAPGHVDRRFQAVWSLALAGPTGPTPTILATFPSGYPFTVGQLAMTATTAPRWQAFAPLADVAGPVRRLAPLAADPAAGITHVAYVTGGNTLRLRCVAEGVCCPGGACTTLDLPAIPAGATLVGLGPADLDADGTPELVLYLTEAGPSAQQVAVRVVELTWSGPALVGATLDAAGGKILGDGTGGSVATIAQVGCGSPLCPDNAYAALGNGAEVASIFEARGGGDPLAGTTPRRIDTPSSIGAVAATGGSLYAGMRFGVWRGRPGIGGGFLAWELDDPVLAEAARVGVVRTTAPGYGETLAACAAPEPSYVVSTSTGTARYTLAGVDVAGP